MYLKPTKLYCKPWWLPSASFSCSRWVYFKFPPLVPSNIISISFSRILGLRGRNSFLLSVNKPPAPLSGPVVLRNITPSKLGSWYACLSAFIRSNLDLPLPASGCFGNNVLLLPLIVTNQFGSCLSDCTSPLTFRVHLNPTLLPSNTNIVVSMISTPMNLIIRLGVVSAEVFTELARFCLKAEPQDFQHRQISWHQLQCQKPFVVFPLEGPN